MRQNFLEICHSVESKTTPVDMCKSVRMKGEHVCYEHRPDLMHLLKESQETLRSPNHFQDSGLREHYL